MSEGNNENRLSTSGDGVVGEKVSLIQSVVARFKALWVSFLASTGGKECLTCRGSWLVAIPKLPCEVWAELVRMEMSEKDSDRWRTTRILVDYDGELKPVLFAKIVTTARPISPRLYRKQRWCLFKRYEQVMLLFVHDGISSLEEAITLSDLARVYEENGMETFAKSVRWIGVGAANAPRIKKDEKGNHSRDEFRPRLGNRVDSVHFDPTTSTFVVAASDREMELLLG